MQKADNREVFKQLRKQHPVFYYDDFVIRRLQDSLEIVYHFSLGRDLQFRPTLHIPWRSFFREPDTALTEDPGFRSLVFHIGLAEMISYWKCCCAPIIIIKPYSLDIWQINWWKKLIYKGLGEFRYLNTLDVKENEFVTLYSEGDHLSFDKSDLDPGYIVPIGGGKDSTVSLELIKSQGAVTPFLLNPNKAMVDTSQRGGYAEENCIVFQRSIDPVLLDLNTKGYLNGHTPFSALIAFQSELAAKLCLKKFIALSNESSANESTIPGTEINHQYSKSFEFESDFRTYCHRFLLRNSEYFSFLRPLSELQIASRFAAMTEYHSLFRSCNAGNKTNEWCGSCPKCLFAFIILSPFIECHTLINIFGKDLFEDPALESYFFQLTGDSDIKPFDCVGTVDEVNLALQKTILSQPPETLPYLLRIYREKRNIPPSLPQLFKDHLSKTDPHHFVPEHLFASLKVQP